MLAATAINRDDKLWYKFTLVSITNANATTDSDGTDEITYFAADLYNAGDYMEHLYQSSYTDSSPLEMESGQSRSFTPESDYSFDYLSAEDCYIKFILVEGDSSNSTTS